MSLSLPRKWLADGLRLRTGAMLLPLLSVVLVTGLTGCRCSGSNRTWGFPRLGLSYLWKQPCAGNCNSTAPQAGPYFTNPPTNGAGIVVPGPDLAPAPVPDPNLNGVPVPPVPAPEATPRKGLPAPPAAPQRSTDPKAANQKMAHWLPKLPRRDSNAKPLNPFGSGKLFHPLPPRAQASRKRTEATRTPYFPDPLKEEADFNSRVPVLTQKDNDDQPFAHNSRDSRIAQLPGDSTFGPQHQPRVRNSSPDQFVDLQTPETSVNQPSRTPLNDFPRPESDNEEMESSPFEDGESAEPDFDASSTEKSSPPQSQTPAVSSPSDQNAEESVEFPKNHRPISNQRVSQSTGGLPSPSPRELLNDSTPRVKVGQPLQILGVALLNEPTKNPRQEFLRVKRDREIALRVDLSHAAHDIQHQLEVVQLDGKVVYRTQPTATTETHKVSRSAYEEMFELPNAMPAGPYWIRLQLQEKDSSETISGFARLLVD